jgi:hypothetical protein
MTVTLGLSVECALTVDRLQLEIDWGAVPNCV